jgi:outer membrane usher protein
MLKNNLSLNKKITICLICSSLMFSNVVFAQTKKDNNLLMKTYVNDIKVDKKIKYLYVKKGNKLYINGKNLKQLKLPLTKDFIKHNKEKYYLVNKIKGISFYIDDDTNTVYLNTSNAKKTSKKIINQVPAKIILPTIKKGEKDTSVLSVETKVLPKIINDYQNKSSSSLNEAIFSNKKTNNIIPIDKDIILDNSNLTDNDEKKEPIKHDSEKLVKNNNIKLISSPEKEILLLDTFINEAQLKQSFTYLYDRKLKQLYISEKDISKININKNNSSIKYENQVFYMIDSKSGATYKIDESNQTVYLRLERNLFNRTILDAAESAQSRNAEISKHLTNEQVYKNEGGFLNYDVYGQKDSKFSSLNTLLSANYFNKYGEGEFTVVNRNNKYENINSLTPANETIRLNTSWTKHDLDTKHTYIFGDFSTTNNGYGRNVFLGGLSFSKNFSLNPNFNKNSTPALKGYSSLPSVVDVYLNNSNSYSFNVPPGEFNINNIPSISGNGQARVVVRDLLGRETTYQQDLFSNTKILKKGVDDYSINIGAERFNYGIESNDYKGIAAVGTYSKGYTDNLTNEYRVEAKKDHLGLGIGSNYKVDEINTTFGVHGWANKNKDNIGKNIGAYSSTSIDPFNFRLSYDKYDQNFYQLGMVEYTDLYTNNRKSLFTSTLGINGHKLTGQDVGNFNISYIENKSYNNDNSKILGFNYNKTFNKNINLNVNYLKNLDNSSKDMLFVGLVYNFDGHTVNYHNSTNDNKTEHYASYQKTANDLDPISFGYAVSGQSEGQYKVGADLRTSKGNISANAYSQNNNDGMTFNARGAIVGMDGDIWATKKINNSFGIIKAQGTENVTVYYQNKPITKTDSEGKAIIPNLSSNTENKIEVAKSLPISIEVVEQPSIYPSIGKRGYISEIKLREKKSFTVNAKLSDNSFVPPGSTAKTFDIKNQIIEEELPVGKDGLIYGNYSYMVKKITVTYFKNGIQQNCSFEVNIPKNKSDIVELEGRICK